MEAGAKGCEIEISGKLTSERARTEKFVDGTMVHTGDPAFNMVNKGFDVAVKKLGVLGVSVRIIPSDILLPDEFKVKVAEKTEEAEKEREIGTDVETVAKAEASGGVKDEDE
jgi:small subunit ribosomal protein S3